MFEPTQSPPGSLGKIAVLKLRADAGLPLFHPDDSVDEQEWTQDRLDYILAKNHQTIGSRQENPRRKPYNPRYRRDPTRPRRIHRCVSIVEEDMGEH